MVQFTVATLQEIATSACQSLTSVYLRQAEEFNAKKDVDAALDAYNKCLNAAERADNPAVLSKAHYQMGMLYHQHGKWTVVAWRAESLSSYQVHWRITRKLSHQHGKRMESARCRGHGAGVMDA
eukprot:1154586-Pelagomonas_calceolata.AAC.2